MIVYLKNQSNYKMKDFDRMSYEEIRPIFEKVWDFNHNFVPMDLEIEKEKKKPAEFQVEQIEKDTTGKRKKSLPRKRTRSTTKRQKVELDDEKEDLKGYLDIVPREDVVVDVDSLSTKYPIVDWKTYTLSENFMYYKIIRGDGSSKNYKILSEMLYDFDRQDIVELYRLVKERYSSSKPEGYDLMLWGDLHTLFEPDEESEIWMNQNEYNLISWSLCDFCGVHILLMQNGIAIHMLTEKKYPLSQEMISKMLSKRLEVDQESTQAYELLKFIRSQGRIVGNKSSSRVNTAKVKNRSRPGINSSWCDNHDLSRVGNQSIERDRLIGIGLVMDLVKFLSFTFGGKEMTFGGFGIFALIVEIALAFRVVVNMCYVVIDCDRGMPPGLLVFNWSCFGYRDVRLDAVVINLLNQSNEGVKIIDPVAMRELWVIEVRKSFIYAFSDSLLLTPLCCDDIHDVTPRVSALAGCDRLVSEPGYREVGG
ncbi:hypothetical protein Tco_0343272 [Tanacetum coccineum]